MKTIDLLRQSAPGLARLIEAAGEAGLRTLAVTVARAAVSRTGLSDPVVSQALSRLQEQSEADAELQARVQAVAARLDEHYFALKEPLEEREGAGKNDPKVRQAFAAARAASSVAAAFGDDAWEAAASAAYEAFVATDDLDYLADAIRTLRT